VEAIAAVRPIRNLRVYSPTRAHREAFAKDMAREHGLHAEAMDNPRDVYRGADILAACTDSVLPVIRGEWLEPGMHVISIGGRPDEAARARFDRRLRIGTAAAPVGRPELATADEYLGYIARPGDASWAGQKGGRKAPVVTGTEGDVFFADIASGRAHGRTSPEHVTYSERGNIQGAQFHAVAAVVYEAALAQGLGREIPTDWFLQDIRD
jgi:alanine dehydrogenase